MSYEPAYSPWGLIQTRKTLCPGFFDVSTASHGGLMDRGLYTAPVNEYFGPGEYSKCIDDTIRVCHPDYWRAHEAGLTQPTQQTKIRERDR